MGSKDQILRCETTSLLDVLEKSLAVNNDSCVSVESSTLHVSVDSSDNDFGDKDCGEPFFEQQLVLDFSPSDELDNDEVKQKCIDFWVYIRSRPDIQQLRFEPDSAEHTDASAVGESPDWTEEEEILVEERPKTVLSMLEFVEEKGLINRMFEVKMERSHCDLQLQDYYEAKTVRVKPATTKICKKNNITPGCTCKRCIGCESQRRRQVSKPSANPASKVPAGSTGLQKKPSSRTQTLCKQMRHWDRDHPKSMDPPGHPPVIRFA